MLDLVLLSELAFRSVDCSSPNDWGQDMWMNVPKARCDTHVLV